MAAGCGTQEEIGEEASATNVPPAQEKQDTETTQPPVMEVETTGLPAKTEQLERWTFTEPLEASQATIFQQVTVKELDWSKVNSGEAYEIRMYNTQLDFSDFRLTLTSVESDAEKNRVTVHVQHPKS